MGQAGPPPYGDALFLPDLVIAEDGTFEVLVSPQRQPGNWLRSTASSNGLLVRQFYPTPDNVEPMVLTLENLSNDREIPSAVSLDVVVAGVERAGRMYAAMLAMMQGELLD